MTWLRVAEVCGVLVAVFELFTGIAHGMAGNWKALTVWIPYAVAAAALAFMK